MQAILGSGGAVGRALVKALHARNVPLKLISRHPQKVYENDMLFAADLTDSEATSQAVEGTEVVYLTLGLPFDLKVWHQTWPLIIKNVIAACLEHQSKLVFFDNIYLYDGTNLNPIKESSAINPATKKGKIRARLNEMIQEAINERGLVALVARSADFYGPGVARNGILRETIIKPLSEGGTANLLASDHFRHSYTYLPDAARAMSILGNTPEAFGQVWHLPTASNPLTGKEMVELVAQELEVKPKYRVISKFLARVMGVFIPSLKESVELFYQYNRDYVFDSSKFEHNFSFQPTPYSEGIRAIIKADYQKQIND